MLFFVKVILHFASVLKATTVHLKGHAVVLSDGTRQPIREQRSCTPLHIPPPSGIAGRLLVQAL